MVDRNDDVSLISWVHGVHNTMAEFCIRISGGLTACTEEFFEVEKCVENGIKSTNSIAIFYTLKSVSKVKIFLLCHLLFAKKFNFNYTF